MTPAQNNQLSRYQRSLLQPELKTSKTRVPGTFGSDTIPYHRSLVQTFTVNANGHFAVMFCHNEVVDSGSLQGTSWITNTAAAYDPSIAPASIACTPLDLRPLYNLTAATVKTSRLVSGAIAVTSLSTALNRTGTITAARIVESGDYIPGGTYAMSSAFLVPTLSSVASFTKKEFSVANGFGPLVCWIPCDMEDYQLQGINVLYGTRHGAKENVGWTIIIGQGLQASSTIRVEYWANFEVTPTTGGSLVGLESPGPFYNCVPQLQAEFLMKSSIYNKFLIRSFMASDQGGALPLSVNNIGKKKILLDDADEGEVVSKANKVRQSFIDAATDFIPYAGPVKKLYNMGSAAYEYLHRGPLNKKNPKNGNLRTQMKNAMDIANATRSLKKVTRKIKAKG